MHVLTPNVIQQLSLSFSKSLSSIEWQNKSKSVLSLTVKVAEPPRFSTLIRMGGGPRTYPGGVSKWQWKRMQAKKAKQLMKARLCRERQIYEMRKRAELKAAVSELERPWEVVDKPPKLFSVRADEQLKVLADRFQKPGGFDLWTEKDGPQLFQSPDELPSARFFPKGVVHSIKPYRKVTDDDLLEGPDALEDDSIGDEQYCSEDVDDGEGGSYSPLDYERNGLNVRDGLRMNENGRSYLSKDIDRSHDGEGSSPLNYRRNGVNVRGGLRGNGRRYLSDDVEGSHDAEGSSPLNYKRNGVNVRGGLRKNGNGRRYLSQDVNQFDDGRRSPFNGGSNGLNVDGGKRRNGNERRYLSEDVDGSHDEESYSSLNFGRNGVNIRGGMRRNANGRKYVSQNADRFGDERRSSLNSGRNGLNVDRGMRRNGNGRKFFPKGVDGSGDGEHSSPLDGRNGASFDGKFGNKGSARRILSKDGERSDGSGDSRLRRKENGRRFVSKDVHGSNEMYAGRDSSDRTHRGSNSLAGRSHGRKYARRTSNYASRRVRDADSEVYDMDLQQDGSYGILRKSEQSDHTSG